MTASSLQFALSNTTTIENLTRKTIVWTLALYLPTLPETTPTFRTISYSAGQTLEESNARSGQPPRGIRTFAILHTKPGENPFDLGIYNNFKSVMGDHWYDWLLPIRYSPCSDHDRQDSQFALGPVVQRMRREAGIVYPEEVDEKPHRRRKHNRRRRDKNATCAKGLDNIGQEQDMKEKYGHGVENGRNEIDLEEGLGRTRQNVH